jgi:hypothetical protein
MKVGNHVGNQRHLKAETLGPGAAVAVQILAVKLETVGDDRKAVLYFTGHQKGLPLNVTNFRTLIELFGTDESDDWLGRRIELYTTGVEYQGRHTLGIRIRGAATTTTGRPQPRRPEPPPVREPGEDDEPLHAADIRW